MVTKRNLIGIAIAALLTCVGIILFILGEPRFGYAFISVGSMTAFVFGLIMLLAESTIVGTVYWKIILGTWLFANVVPFLGFIPDFNVLPIVIAILVIYFTTYLLWFFKKEIKGALDYLKLLWVLGVTLIPIGVTFKIIPSYLIYSADVLLWLMIAIFLIIAYKSNKMIADN